MNKDKLIKLDENNYMLDGQLPNEISKEEYNESVKQEVPVDMGKGDFSAFGKYLEDVKDITFTKILRDQLKDTKE